VFYRAALAALLLTGCKQTASVPVQPTRVAVLRFENLSGNPAEDWQGRALSELLGRDLGSAQMPHVTSPVPGISSERLNALTAGATRLVIGYYTGSGDSLSATAYSEDPRTQKLTGPIKAVGSLTTVVQTLAQQLNGSRPANSPQNLTALKEYALAQDSAGPTALVHYDLSLKSDPTFAPAYLGLVRAAAAAQDLPRAQLALADAMSHADKFTPQDRAYLQLSSADLSRDPSARLDALRALLATDQKNVQTLRELADAEMSARQPQPAEQHYRQLSTLLPNDANVRNLLAYAAMYAGDESGARAAAQEYRRLLPQDPNAFDSAGDIELAFGHFAEAEKSYLASPVPRFQDYSSTWKAARARLMSGDTPGASALFEKHRAALAGINPSAAAYRAAEWLYLTGHAATGVEAMSLAASQATQAELKSAAYTQAAIWAAVAHDNANAAKWSDLALHPATNSTFVTAATARFLAQPPASPGEWKQRAETNFKGANAAGVRNLALGYALLLSKQFPQAATVWKQLYESTTVSDAAPAYLYGWALLETGHPRDAAPLLRLNPIPSAGFAPSFETLYVPAFFEWRKSSLRQ
jgi:Flp pilus assembly protein TadD